MIIALRSVVSGCLWSLVGFAVFALCGLILKPLGLIDLFVAGEPGEPMRATPLDLVLCGAFMGGGFVWGAVSAYFRGQSSPNACRTSRCT